MVGYRKVEMPVSVKIFLVIFKRATDLKLRFFKPLKKKEYKTCVLSYFLSNLGND